MKMKSMESLLRLLIWQKRKLKLKKDKFIEIDISKTCFNEKYNVSVHKKFTAIAIVSKSNITATIYVGENDLAFKEANKVLNILGYKLVDSSKKKEAKKVEEIKRDQIKYGLAKRTLKEI